jgi:hypothetical protein
MAVEAVHRETTNLQLSFAKSASIDAKVMNSEVQTGVKSAGC